MIIDTSAIIAILQAEDDAERLAQAIAADAVRLMSAASILEASIVFERRRREAGGREIDLFLHEGGIEAVPFDAAQLRIARRAFRTYGRGNHPARLNYGDCFSYALSKATGEPLLFKGGDFALTDVDVVLQAK